MTEKEAQAVVVNALKSANAAKANITKMMSPPEMKKPQSPEVRFEQLKEKTTKLAYEASIADAMYPIVVNALVRTIEKAADEDKDFLEVFYDNAGVKYNDDMPQRARRRQIAGEMDSIDYMGRMRPSVFGS